MKRLNWKWMEFSEKREGNSPWIADICCPERTLFPMAPGRTWKTHILWGIVGAGFPMAAWAFIASFMKGFKSFHFWEPDSIIWGFLQTLNYILRQNDLGSLSAVSRAGKVNPGHYKWTSGLVPYFCNLAPRGAWPLVSTAPVLTNDIVMKRSLLIRVAKPVCSG